MIEKCTCSSVLIAALFTVAGTWNSPSMDEWIKLWYIYTIGYYLTIKGDVFESVLIRWMNLEPSVLSEVRKRKANIIY